MATPLRIATFNLENLDDEPGDKPTLAERVRVMRPQLVRLRADVLVLQEVNGQEQGGARTLAALGSLIQGTQYAGYTMTHTKTAGNNPYDVRNLVILSRFPILDAKQLKHDRAPQPKYQKVTASPPETEASDVTWERPMLYAKLDLGAGRVLHLIDLHLKSKLPSAIDGQQLNQYTWRTASGWAEGFFISTIKRVGQALEARILVDEIFDAEPDAFIAVCGDFNDDSHDLAVTTIRGPVEETGNPALGPRVLVPCESTVPGTSRYSLWHLGHGNMLDHVLVSRPLLAYYRGTAIHNENLPDESGAFRTDVNFPESDHAPVVAEFELP
ncbi:MAG TPA: endonuclease/exonuclease/phosphatase family protein [Polyangiaceae bacterium]|nr:endonuclease/exonuclease/phosphatase family protein [Polyangiaceae bacterium]